jgi:hypothetical protein
MRQSIGRCRGGGEMGEKTVYGMFDGVGNKNDYSYVPLVVVTGFKSIVNALEAQENGDEDNAYYKNSTVEGKK